MLCCVCVCVSVSYLLLFQLLYFTFSSWFCHIIWSDVKIFLPVHNLLHVDGFAILPIWLFVSFYLLSIGSRFVPWLFFGCFVLVVCVCLFVCVWECTKCSFFFNFSSVYLRTLCMCKHTPCSTHEGWIYCRALHMFWAHSVQFLVADR